MSAGSRLNGLEPKIAISNIFGEDAARLADFAYKLDFKGIEWSVDPYATEIDLLKQVDLLHNFEVRFHMRWPGIDFAYADSRSNTAMDLYRRKFEIIAIVGGKYATIHLGLRPAISKELDWVKAINNLTTLVDIGAELGITVCLENIVANWTGRPDLYEQIVKKTGARVTLDIGHIHVCQINQPEENIYEKYTLPNREKILGAHVYHTEVSGIGHVGPDNLSQLDKRLSMLDSLPNCKWWLIELTKPVDVLRTRRICQDFMALSMESRQLVAAN